MAYQFPPDVAQRIKAYLACGEYATEDDVLRDAIQALDARSKAYQDEVTRFRAELQESIEQADRGESRPLDPEALKREIRKELAEEGISE
jgi:Arc/MetJ-type ribon-helix-helix transcriptional regulator